MLHVLTSREYHKMFVNFVIPYR